MTPPAATAVKGGARPKASPRPHDREGIERVYVWDIVVRLSHWVIMLAIFILAITGIYIGEPYLIPAGPANEQFVMATMKTVHFYAAIIFALTVATRIAWMFVGSYYARWHQFVPVGRRRRGDVFRMLKFYSAHQQRATAQCRAQPLGGHHVSGGIRALSHHDPNRIRSVFGERDGLHDDVGIPAPDLRWRADGALDSSHRDVVPSRFLCSPYLERDPRIASRGPRPNRLHVQRLQVPAEELAQPG